MLCPACLTFDTDTDAVSTVDGTVYCAPHAVEALRKRQQLGHGPAMNRFTDPRTSALPGRPA